MFADHLSECMPLLQQLLTPPTRLVRVHDDVVDNVEYLVEKTGEKKLSQMAKYTCWPDYDTWIEWSVTGIEDLPEESKGRLDFGFYFDGTHDKSVLQGNGLCIIAAHKDDHPALIPVRYDMENYKIVAHDLTNYMLKRRDHYPPALRDKIDGYLAEGATPTDPIAFAAQHAPVLDSAKPLLFGILAFMNSPKLIRSRPVDVSRLNARRLKRGKYPYHPHHEVRLNIDKHDLKITQGQGDGPERCLHFVRSHMRFLVHPRYKNVSVVLVPPHYRGNPELGIRNTSYAVDRKNSKWNN